MGVKVRLGNKGSALNISCLRVNKTCLTMATLTLSLVGCVSVDQEILDREVPEPPDAWTAGIQIEQDRNAIQDFSDPENVRSIIESLGEIPTGDWIGSFNDGNLRDLVSEAMTHNNNLQAAIANLAAARSNVKVARSALFPSLNTSANAGRIAAVANPLAAAQAGNTANPLAGLRANDLEDQFGVDADQDGALDGLDLDQDGIAETPLPNRRIYINNYQLQAQINWELDVWGRVRDETNASFNDANASLSDLEGARLSVAASVAQGWFGLIEARQQRELAERTVSARESNLRITERRYQRGVASSLDVRLSRSQLASDKAALLQRRQLEKEASRRLEVLLGRYPGAELEAAKSLPQLPSLEGVGAPADLLVRRPDVIAAEARMEAAGLRARAARKQMLPALTISAQVNTSGPDLADVIDPERIAGNLFSGIAQPIFQGGRLRANEKRARAQAEAAIYSYADTVLGAYEEAENALTAELITASREEALKLAFHEARAAEELTERRYNSGAATIFNLLDAQTRRIVAESQYINVTNQRVQNRVQLYLAIGGNFLTNEALILASQSHRQTIKSVNPDEKNLETQTYPISDRDPEGQNNLGGVNNAS